ncbi:MAG: glycosyltransferase family 4 protein [Bacteroidetes bacterium]|nr:glycosyltransferase family 4 protein [Bacteroidota bacterium]
MRIIYYSPHPTHDIVSEVGYSTHQRETIGAMRKLGHEVIPVIMGGTEKSEVENYHADITRGGWRSLLKKSMPLCVKSSMKDYLLIQHDKRAAARLREAIEQHKPDLVYERNEFMQDKGLRVCREMRVKHFLEVNSPVVEEMREWEGKSIFHGLAHKKEKYKFNHTDHIFCVSSVLEKFIREKYAAKKPVSIIPNCINPQKDLPGSEDSDSVKHECGANGRKIIGFVGSIFPYHGVDKLIKAFVRVHNDYPESFLMIVGDGIMRRSYEKLAAEILKEGSYLFTGKIPHSLIMAYIGAFDIAVMPDSNWYGSPIKIFEYGIMERPIVAPDNGPVRDVMQDRTDGLLVSNPNEALEKALLWALNHNEEMTQMGRNFKRKILENYVWEKQAAFILKHC